MSLFQFILGRGMQVKVVRAVHVNEIDNCVTLTDSVCKGDFVSFAEGGAERSITALEDIPKWHKMAIAAIDRGSYIHKYGADIGVVFEDIKAGDHVHIHNVRSPGGG